MLRYDYLLHYITELPAHIIRLRLDMSSRVDANSLTGCEIAVFSLDVVGSCALLRYYPA